MGDEEEEQSTSNYITSLTSISRSPWPVPKEEIKTKTQARTLLEVTRHAHGKL